MSNFFKDVVNDLDAVQQEFLGPNYEYWNQIKSPDQLGMSGDGNLGALGNDIAGLVKYIKTLVTGGGATTTSAPLGDRFFLKTGAKCVDVTSGDKVTRSLYIDNIPNGDIPFISSGLNHNFNTFEGIIPGTMQAAGNLNPLSLFQSFMEGTDPSCAAVSLPVRSVNNVSGTQTGFVTETDIRNIDPCIFVGGKNPVSGATRGNCGGGAGGFEMGKGICVGCPYGVPAPPPPTSKTGVCAMNIPGVAMKYGALFPQMSTVWGAACPKGTSAESCMKLATSQGPSPTLCTWTPSTEGFKNQNSKDKQDISYYQHREHKEDIAHYQNIIESMLFLSAVLVLIFILSKSLKK